jgi:hypothetical protein
MDSMEVVHASYLDLASNITDLRARVDQWQAGDEASLNIAKEKMERVNVILAATSWPPELKAASAKIKAGNGTMKRSLESKDQSQASAAAKIVGDGSHDLTHSFYGDWLPGLKSQHFSPMAMHVIYLDLNNNIADLKMRVAAWDKGDEASLNIASEKLERIQVLVTHALSTGVMAKPLMAIGSSLPAVSAALGRKNAATTVGALKPLSDAAHDLTHDFYAWLNTTAGSDDPACVQAAYADLSANLADLKTRVTAWEQGDADSLNIAQEKVERIQTVLAHNKWSPPMLGAIQKIDSALPMVIRALKQASPALTQRALVPVSDASHDVTHAYYGDFLPQAHSPVQIASHSDMPIGQSAAPMAMTQSTSGNSDSHSHGGETIAAPDPNRGWILGGFGAVNVIAIALAAFFKTRLPKKKKAAKSISKGEIAE